MLECFYYMKKLVSIVGPTATGKTSLALWLSERLIAEQKIAGVDLISADSRQVYRELPIISGADIPDNVPEQITIHGVGIINVDEEWSVAHFRNWALPIIEQSITAGHLPIIVGGTGLYHRHLFNLELAEQPGPDLKLRAELQILSVEALQSRLGQLSAERLVAMNDSDRQNPRRLVRAIEQVTNKRELLPIIVQQSLPNFKRFTIGLTDSLDHLEQKIAQRVAERWQQGAVDEVKKVMEKLESTALDLPGLSATGVKEIGQYLDGQSTEEHAKQAWILREFQYAKRQLTWWKKESEVKWYQVDHANWKEMIYQELLSAVY